MIWFYRYFLLFTVLLPAAQGFAQLPQTFLQKYQFAKTSGQKGEAIIDLIGTNNDSLMAKSLPLLAYFKKNDDDAGVDYTRLIISMLQNNTGDFANNLKESFDALTRFETSKDEYGRMWAFAAIANSYAVSKNYDKAIYYYKQESGSSKKLKDSVRYINTINNIAYTYALAKMPDSGIVFARQAVSLSNSYGYKDFFPYSLSTLGENYMAKNDYAKALPVIRQSYLYLKNDAFGKAGVLNDLIQCFAALNEKDSVLYYARLSINISKQNIFNSELLKTYESLYHFFDKANEADSSNKYFRLATAIKDTLFNIEKIKIIQDESFNHQLREQETASRQLALKNKIKVYGLLTILIIFIIVVIILYRNNKQKQEANKLLKNQKNHIENQRDETRKLLDELKSTQAQLIQSEKMASLGELTAGIAHEIQNPLNFVNNFSEVNTELIKELVEEVDKGNTAEIKIIANDIKENEEKINHHGKRADAIVKGMLQHSRSSSGIKEPTDINALCDEYLRLSYHGLRAKDKSFNATIKTDFDNSIGKIDIVPQEIGRVILNLLTNAFYAVNDKKKKSAISYQPTVTISTACSPLPGRGVGGEVTIKVEDNGNGIPQNIVDKIFQPFFTTKPTGQGTGLGLSLSYDIITKGHGGELKVETMEGEGTTFIIQLPLVLMTAV